ncbi:MAG: Hsp20/alpha crystallin family protein [Alphaproteobacteria bacterium]|nr:Hsp20/alpha crystallin family protein [Alphaproteobacteria bacterium]
MNKLLFSLTVAAALMTAAPVNAQAVRVRDPFNSFFDAMMFAPQPFEMPQFAGPKMDVADLKDKIEVKVELPGMEKDEVSLTCENNVLTLSGNRKQETEEKSKDYYLKEISSGSFSRSIRLPKNIDESKIEAEFKNGVLTVIIPKTTDKEDPVKKIPIKG